MKDSYSICIRYETPEGCAAQKHIANTNYRTAKSYLKHFNKLNNNLWNDREQTGIYCMIVSRKYCVNHGTFETTYNSDLIRYRL